MGEALRILLDPLQYAFMVRGLIAAVVTGGLCALVGTYVVLRGMAFFGDALAHSILPGLALGYLLGAAPGTRCSDGVWAQRSWPRWGLGPSAGEGG